MKIRNILTIAALAFTSSNLFADGYVCTGANYKVQLYHQIDANKGTRNPAAMVVSEKDQGTVVTLFGEKIEKSLTEDSVTYSGLGNAKIDGRYALIALEIQRHQDGELLAGSKYQGVLKIRQEKVETKVLVRCNRYRKN